MCPVGMSLIYKAYFYCILHFYSIWRSFIDCQQRTAEKIKDPMFRFFEREVVVGVKLLKQVRQQSRVFQVSCVL